MTLSSNNLVSSNQNGSEKDVLSSMRDFKFKNKKLLVPTLMYLFEVSKQIISTIVLDIQVREALINGLQTYYEKYLV